MALKDSVKWPYNASGGQVALGISWGDADPLAFQAKPHTWRKVSKDDADKLRKDPRLVGIFNALPKDIQEVVNAVAEGRGVKAPAAEVPASSAPTKPKVRTIKDELLDKVEAIIAEAEAEGDITGQLRGVELQARLHALLSQKTPEEDRVITINVITGVPRK